MGLDNWVMGQGSSSSARTGGQVPWCPHSRPEAGSQDLCCRVSQAVGQDQLPPGAPTVLDAAGTLCTCLFATSSHNTQFLGDFYYLFKLLGIYCRLASAWFGGVGGAGKAEKELEACSLGFLRSDSASSPPASGTFLLGVLCALSWNWKEDSKTLHWTETLLPTSLAHLPRTCRLVQFQL